MINRLLAVALLGGGLGAGYWLAQAPAPVAAIADKPAL